jgi:leucyl/phenylalanyl-tRNA--protein transferase
MLIWKTCLRSVLCKLLEICNCLGLTLLDPNQADQAFPPVALALSEPDGLLAVGGCLSTQRIINAYSQGIFPWYSDEDPILWWSPDPRLVIFPKQLHISKSLHKTLRRQVFQISIDTAFRVQQEERLGLPD